MSHLKLNVRFLLFAICHLLLINSGVAQLTKFDAQFAFKKSVTQGLIIACNLSKNNFLMGDANFRFDYYSRVIANPKITLQSLTQGLIRACTLSKNYNYGHSRFTQGICLIRNLESVAANDTSANTKVVTTTPTKVPIHGAVSLQSNGNFSYVPCGDIHGAFNASLNLNQLCISYVPNHGYVGKDSLCVTVCDSTMGVCNTVNIPLVVTPKAIPAKPVVIVSPIVTQQDLTVTVSGNSGGRCIDSIAPTVKFINPKYANLKSGETIIANCVNPPIFNATSFSVKDNYDPHPTIAFRDLNRTVGTCSRDGYKILMQCDLIATDSCGNRTDFIFFVRIIDTTPPTLSAIPGDITVNNSAPTAPIVTATDDCDGRRDVIYHVSTAPYNCGVVLTRTWTATDECGNTASKSQKITVVYNASKCCKKYTTVSTIYVTAATCNQNATACTEIPYAQIANYALSDNGRAYTGGITNCNGNAGLSLAVGNHNIIFNQKTLACADSLFVKVACPVAPKPAPNTIPLVVNVNEVGTWCLSNIPLLHPVKIMNLCPSSSGTHALINIDQSMMCVTYKGLKVGTDSACLKIISSTNDINFVTLLINVKAQPCGNLINPDSVIVSGTCTANNQVPVCLPVSVSNLQGYTITIDGAPYTTALTPCTNTSTQFFVPTGFHTLRFANTSGCTDFVTVGANCVKSETIITELRVGDKDTMCISSNTLLGEKYYLQNLCAKQSTKVDFNLLGGTTCIERFAKTVGSEKACYILCDEYKLCDTTYMIVNVSELKAKPPVAIDDNVNVLKNTIAKFNVILNDSFGSFTPTLRIVKYPLNGYLKLSQQGEMTYKPTTNYCGADVATYEICTAAGCSMAQINFKVDCNDLIVYSAFSPNNDGRNDYFTIEGIDKLTSSTVSVFNRWGNEVFAAKNYKNNWAGTWNGTSLPEGTYFYVFNDGEGHTLSGYVEIQR